MNTTHQLLSEGIKSINHKVFNISSGGCGLFAYLLATNLKLVGIESKIILVNASHDESDVEKMLKYNHAKNINDAYRNSLKNYNSGGWCHSHIAVEYDGVLYDNEGQCQETAISEAIEPAIMLLMVAQERMWNYHFKASNQGTYYKARMNHFLIELLKGVRHG